MDSVDNLLFWIESFADFFSFIFMFVYALVLIFLVICIWKIFDKAGEPGWACLVPIYSYFVYMRITCNNYWLWFILMLIPGFNCVALVVSLIGLAKTFGKGIGMILLLIFLPFIGLPILAFGDSDYDEFLKI